MAHQSALVTGMHQHFFHGTKASLPVNVGDQLYAKLASLRSHNALTAFFQEAPFCPGEGGPP